MAQNVRVGCVKHVAAVPFLCPFRQPATTVGFFGKKEPAKKAPPKAKVKGLYGPTGRNGAAPKKSGFISLKPKPAAKPAAKPVAKKPVAKKPVAKKPAAKPLFSFGAKPAAKPAVKPAPKKSGFGFGAKPAATGTVKKSVSKYNITKTKGTVVKKKPIVRTKPIATVKISAPTPAKPASPPREVKPVQYDKETVGTLGVASVFAGTFILTLAVIPTALETALEVIGIYYTAYFTYNYITDSSSRDDFGKKLDEINDSTGLDLKKVAQVTGELAGDTSKKLAEQAEKAAEKRAATAAAKKEAEKMADKAVASAAVAAEEKAEEPTEA